MNEKSSLYDSVLLSEVLYFTDNPTRKKLRPCLAISSDDFNNAKSINRVIVAPITKIVPPNLTEFDLLIEKETPDYKSSGLKLTSCVRIDKMYNWK